MKQIIFIAIACLLLLNFSCNKPDGEDVSDNLWQKLNTPYFGKPLDIKFTRADTGYILGAKYSDDFVYNILVKTFDGGKTWQTIAYKDHQFLTDTSGGTMNLIYVSPFNSNIVFSGGNNLIRSNDGGQHWQIINGTNFPAYFFDPLNGMSIGGGISTTTDGGITWEKVFTGISVNSILFTDRLTGYGWSGAISIGITGGYFSSGNLYKTIDGGNTWAPVVYPGFGYESTIHPGVFGLNFINSNTGFIYEINGVGENAFSGSEIYKTTDGGNSWTAIISDLIPKYGYVNNFYMQSETEGFFSTEKGIFHTTDGCKTWQKEYQGVIGQMCFPDAHTGYAIDSGGVVYKRTL